jgi:hypothetical protein
MATPIKITPILSGRASKRFNQQLEAQKNDRISAEEKHRMFSLLERILAKKK